MAKDVETLTTLSDELEKRCEAQDQFGNKTLTCQLGTMNEDQILNKVKESAKIDHQGALTHQYE